MPDRRHETLHIGRGRDGFDDEPVKPDSPLKVKLTRKFSELIDDVNLSKYRVGDVIELPARDAKLLLAEEWAAPIEHDQPKATADDATRRAKRKNRRR